MGRKRKMASSQRPQTRGWAKKDGAYDRIDSVADLKQYVKRIRVRHMVILSDSFVRKNKSKCARCGKPIGLDGDNRTNVFPDGRIEIKHYSCAWGSALEKIGKLRV